MFTTVTETKTITGYDVTEEQIIMAQMIVESYVGRVEVDVQDASDLMLLGRATAYQAAYMKNDPMRVFEQMGFKTVGQFGQMVSFRENDTASPFVAPLAVMACKSVSWRRIRSVRTGSMYGRGPEPERWSTT